MSDTSQGPGWWRASDGLWYPPDTHPDYRPEPPKAPPGPIPPFLPARPSVPSRLWGAYRRLPRYGQIGLALTVVVLVLVGLASIGGGDDTPSTVASDTGSTAQATTTAPPATTTTTLAVPAGIDSVVGAIVDGDSFTTTKGTPIRLIGIDAPDTGACMASEATAHLTEVIPAGTSIRVVYDEKREDSSGRDLAYVYRLPDGVFVNLAMVRDGFAKPLTVEPNVLHADELEAAADDARAARVGIWAECSSSTTSGAAASATSTTRSATTAAPVGSGQVVQEGALCSPYGARGVTSSGEPMACTATASDTANRWRPA